MKLYGRQSNAFIKNASGENLSFLNLDTGKMLNSINLYDGGDYKMNIVIPEGATSIDFGAIRVYEIQVVN